MPNVLELTTQDMTRLHGQVGMLALQGLYPGQLIQTDGAFPLLGPLGRVGIQTTPLDNFLVPPCIGNLCQPIPKSVWLETPFFSSRAACRGEICSTMPRACSSSATSRPVHWLMGRPALAGASQAKAAI